MRLPSIRIGDLVAIVAVIAVLSYSVLVTVNVISGVTIGLWILGIQALLRSDRTEHAIVVAVLGFLVIAGLISGIVWIFLATLIVACSAYTIWTLKYAPDVRTSA